VKRLFALLVGLSVVGTSAQAHAAPRLVYEATADCPKSGEFMAAVRARGGDVELEAAVASDEIDVVIERAGKDYRGTVRVRSAGQSSEPREVRSAACSEVADGLAIVTALASKTGSVADSATPAAPDTNGAATTKNETPHSPLAAPTPPPAPSTQLRTAGQFHDETLSVTSGELRVRNDTAVTLSAGALFGIVPGAVVPRFDLTLARTNFITTPDGAGHIIGSILRTRWTILGPTEYRSSDWSTRFWAFKVSIGGCSQLAYDLSGFVLLACGEIGAGVAKIAAKDPQGRTTSDEIVGVPTAALELDARYNLGRVFHLGLTVGGEAWLSQLTARATDGTRIFHTNPLGAYAMAGLGMHFW
jgi:hypothetical protein